MSKIVKGVKKGIKKVGKFVKKHWKPIAMAAAVAFTGGLATVGFAGLQGAIATNGILGGIGSTMWAGATAAAVQPDLHAVQGSHIKLRARGVYDISILVLREQGVTRTATTEFPELLLQVFAVAAVFCINTATHYSYRD